MSEREPRGEEMTADEFVEALVNADFDKLFDEEERNHITDFVEEKALEKGSFVLAFGTTDGRIVRFHYEVEGITHAVHVREAHSVYESLPFARPKALSDVPEWWPKEKSRIPKEFGEILSLHTQKSDPRLMH